MEGLGKMMEGIRKVGKGMRKVGYVGWKSVELLFLLPGAAVSKTVFDRAWRKYYVRPLEKNLFNLCVEWLLFVSGKVGLTYAELNVIIFCIVWPLITIASLVLNIALLV